MKEPKYLDEAFQQICDELLLMFLKKHKDYGKGNVLDMGELGIAFRISEKFNRVKHLLMNGKKPENESLYETWVDIAVYAVIGALFRKGYFQKLEVKKSKKNKD